MKFKAIRGTHDLFGSELTKYNIIKNNIQKIARNFNFEEIITPIFETTELFSKPLGDQSDVVLKQMYTFLDKNGDSITLRPEYTTPMIRAAISNNLLASLPCKIYGIGPMFRRERPQKGRYRQFNQINFENFGTDDSFAEVELILVAINFINYLIPNNNFKLHVNSLGDRNTLNVYKKELSNFFNKNKQKLSLESQDKIDLNPIRILDSKNKEDQFLASTAPLIMDFLSENALKKYDNVKKYLKEFGVDFKENFSLVRGLDYYCHTVFEIKSNSLGSQDTIIGGGRYDGLIKLLGGKDLPGAGWAGGIERIMMLMNLPPESKQNVHFAILNEKYKVHALNAYKLLIKNKVSIYWNYKFNLKKSLAKSNELKASFLIIVGENEYISKKYTIKDLKTGNQKLVELGELLKLINND